MSDIEPTDLSGTLIERMGMTILSVTPWECIATMPVAGNTQPFGLLHGGASAALAETAGSFAAQAHAAATHPGRNPRAVGLELSITHHRATRSGLVTARARAQHLGRTTATYLVEITAREDDRGAAPGEDRLISSARLTCLLLSD